MRSSSVPGLLLVLLLLAGFYGYVVYNEKIPCVTPLTYSLASYDTRFELPKSEVKNDLENAADVWNDALNEEMLDEGDHPDLPVTFVYDKTQATVDTIEALGSNIDSLKAQLTQVANEYGTLKKQYDALNGKGQATQKMYDDLQTLYARYESLRTQINSDVAKGQQIPTGEVEEGKYVSDASGTRIYIYAFQDRTELKRTLIHELGHALGLNHVKNPESIMYPSNNISANTTLTDEDLAELTRVCSAARESANGRIYIALEPVFNFLRPYISQFQSSLAK